MYKRQLYLYPPKLFPQNPTLGNFKTLFDVMSNSWVPFSRYLFNTLLIAVAGTPVSYTHLDVYKRQV